MVLITTPIKGSEHLGLNLRFMRSKWVWKEQNELSLEHFVQEIIKVSSKNGNTVIAEQHIKKM